MGADVTLADYSEKALDVSREIFEKLGLKASFILLDAFQLPEDILGQYDVVMSFGLIEHFVGDRRVEIINAHHMLLRSGGMAILNSPNAWCFPYRAEKFIREITRTWRFGLEIPFSPYELKRYAGKCGFKEIHFFGWSFWGAVEARLIKRIRLVILNLWHNHSIRRKGRVYPPFNLIKAVPSMLDNVMGDKIYLLALKE